MSVGAVLLRLGGCVLLVWAGEHLLLGYGQGVALEMPQRAFWVLVVFVVWVLGDGFLRGWHRQRRKIAKARMKQAAVQTEPALTPREREIVSAIFQELRRGQGR